jgi:predicted acylesterase/phospholipase RssA
MKKLLVIFATLISIMGLGQKASDSIHYENLVFEGAGIRGLAYCGALMELDQRQMLAPIQRVAGTSSGAITATLLDSMMVVVSSLAGHFVYLDEWDTTKGKSSPVGWRIALLPKWETPTSLLLNWKLSLIRIQFLKLWLLPQPA